MQVTPLIVQKAIYTDWSEIQAEGLIPYESGAQRFGCVIVVAANIA